VVTVYLLKALYTVAPTLTRNMLRKEHEAVEVTQDTQSILDELLGRSNVSEMTLTSTY
jgi:hypothetical protein